MFIKINLNFSEKKECIICVHIVYTFTYMQGPFIGQLSREERDMRAQKHK